MIHKNSMIYPRPANLSSVKSWSLSYKNQPICQILWGRLLVLKESTPSEIWNLSVTSRIKCLSRSSKASELLVWDCEGATNPVLCSRLAPRWLGQS